MTVRTGSDQAPELPDFEKLDRALDRIAESGRDTLLEHEVYSWVEAAGIGTAPMFQVLRPEARSDADADADADAKTEADVEAAPMGVPGERLVLKILHPQIFHKSEVGGVRIAARSETRGVAETMAREVPLRFAERSGLTPESVARTTAGILVVEFVESRPSFGAEMLVGIRHTREFGPTLTVGWGGALAEYMAARTKPGAAVGTLCPLLETDDEAWARFQSTITFDALTGRLPGIDPCTTDEQLWALLRRLTGLARHFSIGNPTARWWLDEFEINPLVFRAGAPVPLDGILRFRSPSSPRLRPPSELIGKLLQPRTIGLIGVSARERNVGRIILENLRSRGVSDERLAIVKAGPAAIDGVSCYPSISELPWVCDLFCVSVSAPSARDCIRELVLHRRARAILLITGGLGEVAGGQSIEKEIEVTLAEARAAQPDDAPILVGGNSLGIQSDPGGIDTMFIPESKLPRHPGSRRGRNLAMASQSGAFLVSRESGWEGVSPRFAVSTGNQIDVGIADLVAHWVDDPAVQTIACYLEGFREGEGWAFARAVRAATDRGKRVVVYKAGRTPAGRTAAQGHTAALASDWDIAHTMVKAAGGMMCSTFREWSGLTMLCSLLADRPLGAGRLAAFSNAGYESVGLADHLPPDGPLSLATFGEGLRDQLRAIVEAGGLDGLQDVRNPLDLTPMASDKVHEAVLAALTMSDEVDLIVAGCVPLTAAMKTTPSELRDARAFAHQLARSGASSPKPVIVVIDGGPLYDEMARVILAQGVPVFRSADEAITLLARWARTQARAG